MTLGESLYKELSGYASLVSLVGSEIYPVMIPIEAQLPCVSYRQISEVSNHAYVSDTILRKARYQVSSWSSEYSDAKAVAVQVRNKLQDFSGIMGTTGVNVKRSFFDGEFDLDDIDPESNAILYHIAQDYIIWYTSD